MKGIWERVAGTSETSAEPMEAPKPDRLTYLVGDIHGCGAKLARMVALIERDRGDAAADIVFLGDYVDRGEDIAGTLADLMALERASEGRVICLAGNHDRMMLDFLDHPDISTGRWLAVGGFSTLTSFGALRIAGRGEGGLAETSRALADAMGAELVDWLRGRPLWWRSGNVVAVHALTEPTRPMHEQSEDTLLWARPDERLRPRSDGTWVVHGHTIMSRPTIRHGHIAVDTGACLGNPLTAAVLDGRTIRFLHAT